MTILRCLMFVLLFSGHAEDILDNKPDDNDDDDNDDGVGDDRGNGVGVVVMMEMMEMVKEER